MCQKTHFFLLELEKLTHKFSCEGYNATSSGFDENFLGKEASAFIKHNHNEYEMRIFYIVKIITGDIIKYDRLGEITKSEIEVDKLTYLLKHNVYDEGFYSLINALAYPAKAHHAYKKLDYKAAFDDTISAINEMHKIQVKIPAFYAAKIQQVRNILRIDFKSGSKEDACIGYNNLMQHLCNRESLNKQFGLTPTSRDSISISIQQAIFEELFLDCAYNLLTFDKQNIDKIFGIVFKNIPGQVNSDADFFDLLLWITATEEILSMTKESCGEYKSTLAFISLPTKKLNDLKFVLLFILLINKEFIYGKQHATELKTGIIKFITNNLNTKRNIDILCNMFMQ